jgi:hypothetical protein
MERSYRCFGVGGWVKMERSYRCFGVGGWVKMERSYRCFVRRWREGGSKNEDKQHEA